MGSARSPEIAQWLIKKGADLKNKNLLAQVLASKSIEEFVEEENNLYWSRWSLPTFATPSMYGKMSMDRSIYETVDSIKYRIVKLLLEKGVNVSIKDDRYKGSPLHWAGGPEVAKLLIKKGANVKARDRKGRTPLHVAIDPDITRLFLEKGANVKARDRKGRTPLHLANNLKVAKLLLEKGADKNAKD